MTTMALDLRYEDKAIRVVGDPDRPEWVGQDVCQVLEIKDPTTSLRLLGEDEKGVHTVHTPGGPQEMVTVTEAGLYRLVFKSRKPEAKKFQRWVFHEVLPSIRKFGTFPPPEGGAADARFVTVGILHNLLAAQREELLALVAARRVEPALPAPGSHPAVPRFTVAERLRFKGWFTATKKQRHTIRRLANALLDSRFQETPDLIGGTCFYAAHQLLCLDESIDRVREDAERAEKAGGPRLPHTA